MKIALIDDLPDEREKIQLILADYMVVNRVPVLVTSYGNAEDFLADFRTSRYDAVFLDIYMDGMNGIEAARKIRQTDNDTFIVFLTASTDHMQDAFRLHAYEYIIKPVRRENLFTMMDDILKKKNASSHTAPGFTFTNQQTNVSIPYDDLVMVGTSAHNYLEITKKSGHRQLTRMTFQAASDLLLQDRRFLLLRRGVIINMAYIRKFDKSLCYLTIGEPVPISQRNRKKLEQIWDSYLVDKMRADAMKRGRL